MRSVYAIVLSLALAAGLSTAAGAGEGASAAGGDGKEAGTSEYTGDMSVEQAWENAKQDWNKLQNTTGDAWEEAKKEFQESWGALKKRLDESPPPTGEPRPSDKK